jgi:hypothetical protein
MVLNGRVRRALVGVVDRPSAAASRAPCSRRPPPAGWRGSWPSTNRRSDGCTHRARPPGRESRNVGDVGDPQQIRPLCREVALDQIRRLTVAALDRRGDELTSAHTGKTCRRHQPGDALATDANSFGRKIDMNARRPIDAARSRMVRSTRGPRRGGTRLSTMARSTTRLESEAGYRKVYSRQRPCEESKT